MAFTRVAALLHAALSDVTATDHHTATVAGDLNLADLAERLHASLASLTTDDHHARVGQGGMESETVDFRYVSSNLVRFSPGVAKGSCNINTLGVLDAGSYNVASVTDTGTGDRTIVWDDDFSAAGSQHVVTSAAQTTGADITIAHGTRTVGTQPFLMQNVDGTDVDIASSTIALGDQD